jgi:hypothetical protein
MKQTSIMTSLPSVLLIFFLTACGSTAAGSATNVAGRLNADYENALPVQNQLILGTLLLEGTENAVTAEQAAELLPMWQLMKEISTSDTAATEELGGLIIQIQETMTAAQIQAITDMALTQEDLMAYMQKAGMGQMPQKAGTPAASGADGATGGGMSGGFVVGGSMPGGGGMPSGGGGIPDGGGMPSGGTAGGANLSAAQIATMEARRASGGGGGNSTALLDALIDMLGTKQAA